MTTNKADQANHARRGERGATVVPTESPVATVSSWNSWIVSDDVVQQALRRAHDLLSMMSAFRYSGVSDEAGGSLEFALWELDDGGAQPASLTVELGYVPELLEHDRVLGTSARDNLAEIVQCLLLLIARAPDLPAVLRHQRALSYVEEAAAVDGIALVVDDAPLEGKPQ